MKYDIKPIDYNGCDPFIAEFLKKGMAVKCDCCDYSSDINRERWVIGFTGSLYLTDCGIFKFARPIKKKKRKAMSFVQIAKWLEDNNYVCDGKGDWVWIGADHRAMPIYPMHLFSYYGREIPEEVFFPEEWLEK